MLETRFPRLIGDIGNPETFPFPVIYETVIGASPERVVVDQDRVLLKPFLESGNRLIERGANYITTSCGFLVYFQSELQEGLSVPVLTSALLQVERLENEVGSGNVGILTISERNFSRNLLHAANIADNAPIESPDPDGEFVAAILGNRSTMERSVCELENVAAAEKLVQKFPNIKVLVLECTNMPPYAKQIEEATGRPVHSLTSYLSSRLG